MKALLQRLSPLEVHRTPHTYLNTSPKTTLAFSFVRCGDGTGGEEKSSGTAYRKLLSVMGTVQGKGPLEEKRVRMLNTLQSPQGYPASEVCPDRARKCSGNPKSEMISTLAKSLAAFCRYCQSIQVPRLFITLS